MDILGCKMYILVPKMYILTPKMSLLAPKMDKMLPFEKVQPQWQLLYPFFFLRVYHGLPTKGIVRVHWWLGPLIRCLVRWCSGALSTSKTLSGCSIYSPLFIFFFLSSLFLPELSRHASCSCIDLCDGTD